MGNDKMSRFEEIGSGAGDHDVRKSGLFPSTFLIM